MKIKKRQNGVSVNLKANSKFKYNIKSHNSMTCIHEKKVNKIDECNLLHDAVNPPKALNI